MVIRPLSTRKKSSVLSCLCQTNAPLTFTTMRSCPLNSPTVRGCQCSVKVESFSARLTGFIFALSYDIPNSWPVTPNAAYQRRGAAASAECACSPGDSTTDGRETKHAGQSGCCLEVSPPQRFTDVVELAGIAERTLRRPAGVLL